MTAHRSLRISYTRRWPGRNASAKGELNPRTPSSGFDDFPRPSHPSEDERHVDARCWMALASQTMVIVGDVIGLPEERTRVYKEAWQVCAWEVELGSICAVLGEW